MSNNDHPAQGNEKLYGTAITPAELTSLADAGHEQTCNVLAVMLDPGADPQVLSYYLVLARDILEVDMRQNRKDIIGAELADDSVPIGIEARWHDEQERSYSSTAPRQDSFDLNDGDGDGDKKNNEDDASSSASAGNITKQGRDALRELDRVQAHIELFQQLSELVVSENVDQYDLVVARVMFFCTLAASRALKAVVMAPKNERRLPEHCALPAYAGEAFFPVLNHLTDMHHWYKLDGERYLRELFCFLHTGSPLVRWLPAKYREQ